MHINKIFHMFYPYLDTIFCTSRSTRGSSPCLTSSAAIFLSARSWVDCTESKGSPSTNGWWGTGPSSSSIRQSSLASAACPGVSVAHFYLASIFVLCEQICIMKINEFFSHCWIDYWKWTPDGLDVGSVRRTIPAVWTRLWVGTNRFESTCFRLSPKFSNVESDRCLNW